MGLERVVDLDVDVVARRLLLIRVTQVLHVDHVIDDLCDREESI